MSSQPLIHKRGKFSNTPSSHRPAPRKLTLSEGLVASMSDGRPITVSDETVVRWKFSHQSSLSRSPTSRPSTALSLSLPPALPHVFSCPPFVAFLASIDVSCTNNIPALTTKVLSFPAPTTLVPTSLASATFLLRPPRCRPSLALPLSPSLSLPSSSLATIALFCFANNISPSLPTAPSAGVSSPPHPSLSLPSSSPATITLLCIADNVSPSLPTPLVLTSPPLPLALFGGYLLLLLGLTTKAVGRENTR